MFPAFFRTHGSLRLSQRKTLAAMVWAVMTQPRLGIAISGRALTMATSTTAKHNIIPIEPRTGRSSFVVVMHTFEGAFILWWGNEFAR